MSGIAIVASAQDAKFAEEVRAGLWAAGLDSAVSTALPQVTGTYVVLIWSAALEAAHSIDAQKLIGLWSEGRLLTVRRDQTPLPLGLRDLPSLDPATGTQAVVSAVRANTEVEIKFAPPTAAPKPKTRLGIVFGALLAIALFAGGAWYYFNKASLEKQAALTAALETAAKAAEELKVAQAAQQKSLKDFEDAKRRELEAIKSGDQAKIKEAQEAVRRAEAEANKQAEAVKAREAAAADARMKAQESARKAKSATAAEQKAPEPVVTRAPEPTEAPKPVAKAPEPPAIKAPEPVAKSVGPPRAKTRSEREREEEEMLARQVASRKSAPVAVASAPQPSTPGEPAAASADMLQQAQGMESSDPRGAVKIYRSLARSGNVAAARRLGEIYEKGIPGIPRDYAESLQWYETVRKLTEIVIAGAPEPAPAARPPAPPVAAAIPEAAKPEPSQPAAAKSAPPPEPVRKAEPAPVPAPAAIPETPKAAAPAPVHEPAKSAAPPPVPLPEEKTGWFSTRGVWIALLVLAFIAWRRYRRRQKKAAWRDQRSSDAPRAPKAFAVDQRTAAPQGGGMLFVSYSHKDRPRVEPIVSVSEELGRRVWMDRADITGQTGWAGQIVRAIRECRAVVLMASPNSYTSDQVVRELYLAMNHKKTIVPIEIEPAEMPDELQYILAPFHHHRLSAGEPREVIGRALAAV